MLNFVLRDEVCSNITLRARRDPHVVPELPHFCGIEKRALVLKEPGVVAVNQNEGGFRVRLVRSRMAPRIWFTARSAADIRIKAASPRTANPGGPMRRRLGPCRATMLSGTGETVSPSL